MLSLPSTNWLRLLVWLIIGLIIYFGYSKKNSLRMKANRELQHENHEQNIEIQLSEYNTLHEHDTEHDTNLHTFNDFNTESFEHSHHELIVEPIDEHTDPEYMLTEISPNERQLLNQ
jgi:hypothetical protein